MYDQEANTQTGQETSDGNKGKADAVGYAHGQQHPVHLCIGNGGQLYVRFVGQGSGQRRDIQNDFTRFFYSYRRHDWVPVWYQTHAE
jgi:hypothetical protein